MAKGKKKSKKQNQKPRHIIRKLIGLAILAVIMVSLLQGSVVRVSCVDLPLRDLPPAFDGTKIVYVSDIHLTTLNSLGKVNRLFERLQSLKPDILLLGGDYTGSDLVGLVISMRDEGAYEARLTEMRDLFFLNLQSFETPMGKYAVAGDMDNVLARASGTSLTDAAALGGVELLRDQGIHIIKDGQHLRIVGTDDWRTGMQNTSTLASDIYESDCVILLSHNPEIVPQLNNRPAAGGGLWIDAALTGHTMGGQIRIGDYEVFSPFAGNERYSAGWHMENKAKMLISEGLCGTVLPMRLGSWAQVHLITLRTQEGD